MKKEYDFSKARRGSVVPLKTGKTRITIRIDNDILDWFRQKVHESGGGNYQTMINETLRSCIMRKDKALEDTLRRVIKEEFKYKIISFHINDNHMRLDRSQSDIEKRLDEKDWSITKAALIAAIADDAKIGKREARKTVEALFRVISNNLERKGNFSLAGFGNFLLAEKKPRPRPIPTTKKTVRVIRFQDKKKKKKKKESA